MQFLYVPQCGGAGFTLVLGVLAGLLADWFHFHVGWLFVCYIVADSYLWCVLYLGVAVAFVCLLFCVPACSAGDWLP